MISVLISLAAASSLTLFLSYVVNNSFKKTIVC